MKQDLETLSKVFLIAVGLAALFWAIKGSFYLMSTRSSLENMAGAISLAIIIACVLLFSINKIKNKSK